MHFIVALKLGATPETEAIRFIRDLIRRSHDNKSLYYPAAADFINEMFKAIGLDTKFTTKQLKSGKGYDWLEAGCRTYIFRYNAAFFAAFKRFILQIFQYVMDQDSGNDDEGLYTPTLILSDLISLWSNVFVDLMRQEGDINVDYFEEPIAHINLYIFFGTHKIRKLHYSRYHVLDSICSVLFTSVTQGLYFMECQSVIGNVMLELICQDYGVCPEFAQDAENFIIEAFTVEAHKDIYINVYKCLIVMLDKYKDYALPQPYKRLKDFLIERQMQAICFTTLKLEKSKRVLIATLDFVSAFQSHLLDLDCFAQVFIEEILAHSINTDKDIAQRAAKIYIEMTRRKKIADEYLLKHIIETYYLRVTNEKLLPTYVGWLWPHFPYIHSMEVFYNLLMEEDMPEEMPSVISHFAVAVYCQMMTRFDNFEHQICFILQKLPTLLKQLKCTAAKGALLMLIKKTDMSLLSQNNNDWNTILGHIEDYFLSEMKHGKNLQYPYILNLFLNFTHCTNETKNFHKLEECGVYVFHQYNEIEKALDETTKPKVAHLRRYCDNIQKLNVMLKISYSVLDSPQFVLKKLCQRLMDKNQFTEFVQSVPFIDAYAIELVVSSCIKFSNSSDITSNEREWLRTEVQRIEQYLVELLCKETNFTRLQYSVFISLVNLYYVFNSASNICKITLNLRPYHILISTLLPNFKKAALSKNVNIGEQEELEMHPERLKEYRRLMFYKFSQLHKSKDIIIPSSATWKIGVFYGLGHKFNDEISDLLTALAENHLKIFTQVQAIAVYNLYKSQPTVRADSINAAIKAHKKFIDNLPAKYSPTILNVNLVLLVLEMLKQSLRKLPPRTGSNRLKALTHLFYFTENLKIDSSNALNELLTQAKALQNNLLNSTEQGSLKSYLDYLKKFITTDVITDSS